MYVKQMFRKTSLLLLMMAISLLAFAQGRSVSGIVTDINGEPVINATVYEKGIPSNGAISDLDGRYTLSNLSENAVLVFSYVGYLTQEIKMPRGGDTQLTINVVLMEDLRALDEVVVVGYGTMKRRDLTGAVASVTGEKLAANPVTNVMQALQGQLPGVNVISQDGRPGASMSIRVRGGGSITQSNEPLFVVDGVQVSSLDDVPAANIESIDVLKDAASTAIYGARGANGVILVTTKGAKEGKPSVRYNVYYQTKHNPKTLDVMDAYDYVLWNWSYASSYAVNDGLHMAQYFGLGSANGNHLNDYRNVEAHNYINDVMRTANAWNHDLSLSGGNADTKYYASVNYSDDQGIRIKSDFKRYSANFKINQKITKNLTFNTDLRYSQIMIDGTQFGMATSVYRYRPIDNPLGDGDVGHLGTGSGNVETSQNPLSTIDNYTNEMKRQRLNARGSLVWNVMKGLKAESEISLNHNWNQTKYWDSGNPAVSPYSEARLTKGDGYGVRWATTVNYEIQGLNEDHKASVLLGNEVLTSNSNSSIINGFGYPSGFTMDNAFGMINMTGYSEASKGLDKFSNTIGTPNNTQSWFGRGNYSYKGRYLLTATFRADGSSKFAPNNRWGYFPAAAAAWRLSDESFMENTSEWLSNLKLRLSYGASGADNIDPSLWRETWKTSTILVDGTQTTVYVPGDMLGNPDLKWETTISRNAGVDFGFLKNGRIRGSIDLYWNSTENILMKVPIDASAGYSYQFQNVGQTSNKGVELALGADFVHTKNWRFGVNLTYNYNHNNVDKLVDGVLVDTRTGWGSSMTKPSYDYIIRVGQPVGLIQGFASDGFYTVNDFNYDAATGIYTLKDGVPDIKDIINYSAVVSAGFKRPAGQNAFPGMVKFKDTDEDGKVDDADKTIIGKTMAEHTGGFNLNAGYKNLDFSAGFIYQIGGKIYNANAMHSMMGNKYDGFGNNRLAFISDTYKVYDVDNNGNLNLVTDPTALNALNVNARYPLNYNEYGIVSSQFIEDASFLRLQNLTVGYTLPKRFVQKAGIQSVRAYFTGSNLFCLSNYSGIDPDVNTQVGGENGFPTPNYDYNSYPKARTYTFGLSLTF
ncbi:MAG: TonB-dependent receptor [Dysgonamonadaceae bacterium]|jgi:TonB-linked SusC/RagA family outer membrane protein|nr:TonB-dependent receptor [Dysgonamonadaceae bacterium]